MGTAVRVAGATKRTSSGVVERCSPHFVSGLIRFHIDGFHIDAPPEKLSCAHDWCALVRAIHLAPCSYVGSEYYIGYAEGVLLNCSAR